MSNRLNCILAEDKCINSVDRSKGTCWNLKHALANLAMKVSSFDASVQQCLNDFFQDCQNSVISQSGSSIELVEMLEGAGCFPVRTIGEVEFDFISDKEAHVEIYFCPLKCALKQSTRISLPCWKVSALFFHEAHHVRVFLPIPDISTETKTLPVWIQFIIAGGLEESRIEAVVWQDSETEATDFQWFVAEVEGVFFCDYDESMDISNVEPLVAEEFDLRV
jgi:hypothetical protein